MARTYRRGDRPGSIVRDESRKRNWTRRDNRDPDAHVGRKRIRQAERRAIDLLLDDPDGPAIFPATDDPILAFDRGV